MTLRCRLAAIASLVCVALTGCGGSSLQNLLYDNDGTGNAATDQFQPDGPWNVAYRWDCGTQHSQGVQNAEGFRLTVYNSSDQTLVDTNPTTTRTGAKGTGSLHFARRGDFMMKIFTVCDWRVTVTRAT